ncbi:hypothetical protein PFLUV_G00066160 [Perca fluviatilis]|uniref:Uncharacterized protein n=1 Tax=Perca fluviatilis TaxID=8168 RepID=A0A6A5FD40_PERFL|nr:hypothetical protein PFLUV_G00066160 [Perca fluviatilis]
MTVNRRHPLGITVLWSLCVELLFLTQQTREPTNEQGAFRRFSAFPEVLDRSDFRLKEFKMAATGSE